MELVKTIQGLISAILPKRQIAPQTVEIHTQNSVSPLQQTRDFHPRYGNWIELDFSKTVQISKSELFSLNEAAPELDEIMIGLGWDDPTPNTDLETYAFICGPDGQIRSENDFVFYNQTIALDGAVAHLLDNTTSVGRDCCEAYKVSLLRIPSDIIKISFSANINSNETLSEITNIFIRIVDISKRSVIAQYEVIGTYTLERSIIFAELTRKENGWCIAPSGSAFDGVHDPGGGALFRLHGLNL